MEKGAKIMEFDNLSITCENSIIPSKIEGTKILHDEDSFSCGAELFLVRIMEE